MSVFLVPQTLEQLYAVGTASISRTVFRLKRGICCQAAKPQFSIVSKRVFWIIYMYVCTRIFSIYFTYFTNSFPFFFFKSYLHNYTITQLHCYTHFSSCLSHFNYKRLFIKAVWENDRVCSFEMLISFMFKTQTYRAAFGLLSSVNTMCTFKKKKKS